MSLSPLISVYIPTHNRVDLLMDRALPSVRGQTYRNLEIIVAAHGCTDDTEKVVRRIGDQRIKVIEVPRRQTYPPTAENHWLAGPVVPANAALKAASGDWIARIDDDDIWTPDHIATLLDFAQRGRWEFVSAGHETHEGKVEPYDLDGVLVGGTQTWVYRSYLRFFRYNPDCWRKDYNRVNDTDLQDRMRRAGVRMGYLDRVLAFVLPRPGETEIGLKAYQSDRDKKEEEFEFWKTPL
jgi:glycosyltransferase involved in cell wall biosynthesis